MEKINNYTKGVYLREGNMVYVLQPSGRYHVGAELMENRIWFGIHGPCSQDEKEATAKLMQLATTLYEQHFKMLEALKHLTSNGGLLKAVYDAGETSLFFESYEKALQTIKECEL